MHFSEKMIFIEHHNKTNLRADAVPDLYLPTPPNSIEELPEETVEQLQGNYFYLRLTYNVVIIHLIVNI